MVFAIFQLLPNTKSVKNNVSVIRRLLSLPRRKPMFQGSVQRYTNYKLRKGRLILNRPNEAMLYDNQWITNEYYLTD